VLSPGSKASRPRLLVLGASRDQLFLIRTARAMGFAVMACDQNPASPGFDEADEAVPISTRDVPALCAFLDRHPQRAELAGVITMGSDIPELVQAVAEHAGLPRLSRETVRLATDKLAMKERFRREGVPIPWFAEVGSVGEIELALERHRRLVLKPVDRSGSRGVFVIDRSSDLPDLLRRSREFSFAGRTMVEEFLEGPQISTESILCDARAATPGFADRNYDDLERFLPQVLENGGWVPTRLTAAEREAVARTAEAAGRALGIDRGVAKGDLVLTSEGPKVIEVAARLSGGDLSESLVPLATGVNYVRAAIDLAVGKEPDFAALVPRLERHVANRYFFPAAGVLERVEGLEAVRGQDWVEKLELYYRPGEEVPPALSHAHRFGVFIVSAPDRVTLEERIDRVYRTLEIVTRPARRVAV
jgi:biotin carboxylase